MFVLISAWVEAHTKIIGVIGSIAAGTMAGGVAIHGYIVGVDHEIEAVRDSVTAVETSITPALDAIQDDLYETKCMLLTHHLGGDPLECIYDD
jgi:hypothetical protein